MRRLIVLISIALGLLLALLAAPALASAHTFYVSPSGGDDTANIQKAFNRAIAAGPGSVVQLGPGTFYTNAIWVKGFIGTFRGAGEGLTTINTPRALDTTAAGVNSDAAATHETETFLVGFSGGRVHVSGMSFDVSATDPADSWAGWGSTGNSFLADGFLVTDSASAAFDHVSFQSATMPDGSHNVAFYIAFDGHVQWDPSTGNLVSVGSSGGCDSVRDCTFTGADCGVTTWGLTDGSLTVGGAAQNSFSDSGFSCCFFADSSDSTIVVSHNQMATEGDGVFCLQGHAALDYGLTDQLPRLPAPRYLIADNQISGVPTGYAGVVLWDFNTYFDAASCLQAAVTGNAFNLGGGDGSCGVAEFGTRNVLCARNTFSGSASWGIYLGDDYDQNKQPVTVSGWRILGDHFSGLSASVAPILLGNGTTHNLVCPTPAGTIDNGIDNWLLDPVSASTRHDPHAAAATPMNSLKQMRQLKEMMRF